MNVNPLANYLELLKDDDPATHIPDFTDTTESNQIDNESDASSAVSLSATNSNISCEDYFGQNHVSNQSSKASFVQPKKKGNLSSFAKRVSLAPYKGRKLFGIGSTTNFNKKPLKKLNNEQSQEAMKETYQRDFERWIITTKNNVNSGLNDPLLNADARLSTFMDFYDSILKREAISDEQHKEDHLAYYAISAIKFVSGVDKFITTVIIRDFINYDLKGTQRMKVLKTHNDFFGIQFSWQFAIDNPNVDFYDYSVSPLPIAPSTSNFQKNNIGPVNFHSTYGKSNIYLPFSPDSFGFCLAYNLFYNLPKNDWVPALKEYHRVLQSKGSISLFVMDFDIFNCNNVALRNFFAKIRNVLERKGIDPYPCKSVTVHLKEAGFKSIKYSMLSMKRGLNNRMGKMMELIVGYMEYLLFQKMASLELDEEELAAYRQLKLQYHQDLRDGKLTEELGDTYCIFVFAKKD